METGYNPASQPKFFRGESGSVGLPKADPSQPLTIAGELTALDEALNSLADVTGIVYEKLEKSVFNPPIPFPADKIPQQDKPMTSFVVSRILDLQGKVETLNRTMVSMNQRLSL